VRPTRRRAGPLSGGPWLALLGALAAGVLAVLAGDGAPVPLPGTQPWLPLLLLAVTIGAELTAVRLDPADRGETLTLFETALVADALLLPPRQAVLVAVAGLLGAAVVVRRSPVDAALRVGTRAGCATVLLATVAAVARPGAGLAEGRTVLALLLGTLGYAAVDVALAPRMLGGTDGPGSRHGWRLAGVASVGSVALGATAVAVAGTAPLLLPFSLLPAAALTYAYGTVAQEGAELTRSQQLLALSHLLAGAIDVEDLVTSFLALVREAFHAETALLVLEAAGREETAVAADAKGVVVRPAHPSERALLATAGAGTVVLADVATATGPARVLLAPLDAEGRRLGVLALTEPVRRRRLSFAALTGTTERGRSRARWPSRRGARSTSSG